MADHALPADSADSDNGSDSLIDPARIEQLYLEHSSAIRSFLIGLLRDSELADEVQQSVFTKALESGHTVQPGRFRGWLFRVANNEAMLLKRRQGVDRRAMQKVASSSGIQETQSSVLDRMSSKELAERVRQALNEIPKEQQQVVRLRMYEGLKFVEIAERTGVPLNTVLTRMRLALGRLAKAMPRDDD